MHVWEKRKEGYYHAKPDSIDTGPEGISFAWRTGHIASPRTSWRYLLKYFTFQNPPSPWFGPRWTRSGLNYSFPIKPRPFLYVRKGSWGFYIGWKTYGADSPVYKTYFPYNTIYDGSVAMHFSARVFHTKII